MDDMVDYVLLWLSLVGHVCLWLNMVDRNWPWFTLFYVWFWLTNGWIWFTMVDLGSLWVYYGWISFIMVDQIQPLVDHGRPWLDMVSHGWLLIQIGSLTNLCKICNKCIPFFNYILSFWQSWKPKWTIVMVGLPKVYIKTMKYEVRRSTGEEKRIGGKILKE